VEKVEETKQEEEPLATKKESEVISDFQSAGDLEQDTSI
jgi:hypothetical protein